MSTRISSVAALLALAGCGADPAAQPGTGETVACGPVGEVLLPVCTLERQQVEDSELLTIHHPDGGFRRLRERGRTITAADGAEPVVVTRRANGVEVTIGGMRYRLAAIGATAGG